MDNTGDRLRWLRTRQGMSIEKAAELSGYSTPQIKKIENGYSPSIACLNALLRAYGTNLPEFFQSAAAVTNEEDRMILEKLQFILDEGRRENSTEKQKKRASAITENIEEFYTNAIRSPKPSKKKAAQQPRRTRSA